MRGLVPGLGSSKTVIVLTDEAAIIGESSGSSCQMVDTIDWTDEEFVDKLATVLRVDCKGGPVVILNDMVEQHYRKERIPKMSGIDKNSIILRRLNNIFAEYQFRSYLAPQGKKGLKMTAGAEGQDVYLFAAFPESDSIRKILEGVRRAYVQIIGFCLLPVESAGMINALADKLLEIPKKPNNTIWTVFLGQQSSGSLRQIVTKDGEFALTRITPIVDTDVNPGAWVKDVAREFQATMGYLTRFGLTQNDELNLIVVANEKTHTLLHQNIENYTHLIPLTLEDAAGKLGISVGQQAEQRYADLLHVGWQGKHGKLVMPMRSASLQAIAEPRKYANYASYVLLLLFAGVTMFSSYNLQQFYKSSANLGMAEAQKQEVEVIYNEDIARKEGMGFNFKLVKGALDARKGIENDNSWPYPVLKGIYLALTSDLKLSRLSIRSGPAESNPGDASPAPEGAPAEGRDGKSVYTVTLAFPKEVSAETNNKKAEEFRAKLSNIIPAYNVAIPKALTDLSYVAAVKNEAGIGGAGADASEDLQDYLIDVVITKRAGGAPPPGEEGSAGATPVDPAAVPAAEGAPPQ
jgi:hypothetical protein